MRKVKINYKIYIDRNMTSRCVEMQGKKGMWFYEREIGGS